MNAPGLKPSTRIRTRPGDKDCIRITWTHGAHRPDPGLDLPPRLCRQDLKDPEQFHRRLVAWLMKQR